MDVIAIAKKKLKAEFAEGYEIILAKLKTKQANPKTKAKAEELILMANQCIEQDYKAVEGIQSMFGLVSVPKKIEKNWREFTKSVPKDW